MDKIKIMLIASIFFAGINLYSQKLKEADVPSAVKIKFSEMYPNAGKIKWEMEDGKYEAEFKENKVESSALFEQNGTYVQTETEITVSSLPKAAADYISKNLPGRKIKEAAKITASDGTVTYEAEVDKDDYIFDSNGNFIRKDSGSGDNEDEDKK